MRWIKTLVVVFVAVVITALGIDAADTLDGNSGTLFSQVIESSSGCPQGMVSVDAIPSVACVDAYEATPARSCPVSDIKSIIDTRNNIEAAECVAASFPSAQPWTFISREQAMQVCARAGKRLPTSAEWYQISLGLTNPEENCNTDSGNRTNTGEIETCRTPAGVYDMVGNVWEWVGGDIIDGTYETRTLPKEGYVAQVDGDGMAVVASSSPSELFESDYFWSKAEGVYGIIRGGFYNSGRDAGLYAVHADTPPTTAGTAIGFRCVK